MHSIRYILIFLAGHSILLFLCSCNSNKSKSLIDDLETTNELTYTPTPVKRADSLTQFISKVSKDKNIRWTYAFSGKETELSFQYDWLSKWATNDELLDLVNNKNTNARVLAFLCLKNRKNVNLKSVVVKHIQDTSSFSEIYGCLGEFKRVNTYFFEATTGWFSENEINKYRKAISALNSKCKLEN